MTERLRKIGEPRVETIVVVLTESQVEEQRAKACDLRDQQDKLKIELAGVKTDFKVREKNLRDAEVEARGQASTRKRHVQILIQDHITPSNEVISIRLDTKDVVGRRTATAEELQEEPFGGGDDDDDEETGFGKPS